ncbi:MAG: 50S ribosomal protein L11 methyltransferase [Bacillota bacterium]|nr:50S ribosomal protein L11 methyltransferase [Bacillota bacterium]
MKYIELRIHASRQGVEMVSELLMRNGITSVSVDDPADLEVILEKKDEYGWDYIDEEVKARPDREPVVRAYLEDTEEGRQLLQSLKLQIMNLKSLEYEGRFGWDANLGRLYAEAETVDDGDWKDRWKEYFRPMAVTDTIVVKPSWEDYEAAPREKLIEIDPGMAFGTGSHETTRLCLRLLEKYAPASCAAQAGPKTANSLPSLLDVGCGSGILAMGGALLGYDPVLGIEIDPDAVEVARENVARNGLKEVIEIRQGNLTEGVDFAANVIVANLMADLVIRLAGDCAAQLKPGGWFISSGILLEKKEAVAKAVREAGFDITEVAEEGEWCAIAARKTGR